MDVIFIAAGLVIMWFFAKNCANAKNPVKTAIVFMAAGLTTLILSGIITSFTLTPLAVNPVTVLISLILGVPGVIIMLIKILFL